MKTSLFAILALSIFPAFAHATDSATPYKTGATKQNQAEITQKFNNSAKAKKAGIQMIENTVATKDMLNGDAGEYTASAYSAGKPGLPGVAYNVSGSFNGTGKVFKITSQVKAAPNQPLEGN